MIIEAAQQYIDATGIRDSVIAKCYEEIGLILAGVPAQQRADTSLTDREAAAMRKAIHRQRREKKKLKEPAV